MTWRTTQRGGMHEHRVGCDDPHLTGCTASLTVAVSVLGGGSGEAKAGHAARSAGWSIMPQRFPWHVCPSCLAGDRRGSVLFHPAP